MKKKLKGTIEEKEERMKEGRKEGRMEGLTMVGMRAYEKQ